MPQLSRRSLLAGSGGALALGVAGCLGRAAPSDDEQPESNRDDESTIPDGLAAAFEYVYPADDAGTVVRIVRPPDDGESRAGIHPTLDGVGTADWLVSVRIQRDDTTESGLVATGDFEVADDADRYTPDGSRRGFDRYRVGSDRERVLVTDGETLLLGEPAWVRSTLDRHAPDASPFLETADGARPLLEAVEFGDQTVLVDDAETVRDPFADLDVAAGTLPDTLAVATSRSSEKVSYTMAGWYADEPDSAHAATLETFLTERLSMSEPTVEVRTDDHIVIARGRRPYTPPEERPETASAPRFVGYDASTGELRFRFRDGEPLPVERYELSIEDEAYTGDWARGQERIGKGDVIAIDADAIEPGDQLSISYESPDGSFGSGSGTTALRHLPFDVDYDPDARMATLTYGEGPPLPADRVTVVVGEDEQRRQPWSGELDEGDAVTLSDLPFETRLVMEYERSDGETVRIGGGRLDAPGRFEFDYDGPAETLEIAYPTADDGAEHVGPQRPDPEPLDASRFEISLDGEAADRQWSDRRERIQPGDTLTLEGVPVDTSVTVDWIGADGTRHTVAGTHTVPDVSFEFDYDAEADEVTVRHAGGQAVDAGALAVRLHRDGENPEVPWDGDGQVTEGDEFVVDDVTEQTVVVVRYRGHHLEHVHTAQLLE